MIKIYVLLCFLLHVVITNGQDSVRLLIVYPDSFEKAAKSYAELRSEKIETGLMPISTAGKFPDEKEIRNTIRSFHSEFPFNHLLLIGSARNVPLHLTGNGTHSDHFYSHLDDDDIPDIAVGRIPVNNQLELQSYTNKVRRIQSDPTNTKHAGIVLTGVSEADNRIGDKVKTWMGKRDFEMKKDLKSASNSPVDSANPLLVFQIGQGTATAWSDVEPPYTILDAENYIYPNSVAIISVACSTAGPQYPSDLGSTLLLNPGSGVYSYIGCTGNCLINWTDNIGFYILQASTQSFTIGMAQLEAMEVFPSLSVMATQFEKTHTINQLILLGDPSLPFPHQNRQE